MNKEIKKIIIRQAWSFVEIDKDKVEEFINDELSFEFDLTEEETYEALDYIWEILGDCEKLMKEKFEKLLKEK